MSDRYCIKCDLETERETCPQCGNPTILRPAQALIENRRNTRRWSRIITGHRVRAERATHGGREVRV